MYIVYDHEAVFQEKSKLNPLRYLAGFGPVNVTGDHGHTAKYRPEIDGLRALAVLAVIVNHINARFLPGGYLGVDIFFVISGYVITGSLLSRSASNISSFFLGFYARRIRRILPALAVMVVIVSVKIGRAHV